MHSTSSKLWIFFLTHKKQKIVEKDPLQFTRAQNATLYTQINLFFSVSLKKVISSSVGQKTSNVQNIEVEFRNIWDFFFLFVYLNYYKNVLISSVTWQISTSLLVFLLFSFISMDKLIYRKPCNWYQDFDGNVKCVMWWFQNKISNNSGQCGLLCDKLLTKAAACQ